MEPTNNAAPQGASPQESPSTPPKKSAARNAVEWILTILAAVALAFIIRTFIAEPVRVDGESMLNTLQNNEYMIATKFDYLAGDPARFDVVICHYPDRGNKNFVKRVVGLPGETVELRAGELYIDGEHIAQDFDLTPSLRDFGPVTVEEDHYFVMGDNRNNSHDSRASDVGALPRDMIKGHVRFVAFPIGSARVIESPGR